MNFFWENTNPVQSVKCTMWNCTKLVIWAESTHQNCSWRSQSFWMWFLWQRSQMWFLWKSFSQSGNLKTNITIFHDGHKDHKCDYCGRCFTKFNKVRNHINVVHEENKGFKCDSCGKSFTGSQLDRSAAFHNYILMISLDH